jgi:hypothetical protein
METIYNYPLVIDDHVSVIMPSNAKILCVQVQDGTPCIWALVNTEYTKTARTFAWRGTGHSCTGLSANKYVGTIQLAEGQLVFHLFDLG